jgi:uncharacterized protein YcbX
MHVSELAIHPLKSARRLSVPELALGPLGPQWDRRWMLVDGDGRFITQRTHPRLCLVTATVADGMLELVAPGMPALRVEPVAVPETLAVTVWEDAVAALAPSPAADAWCSAFLGLPLRLVFMAEDTVRAVSPAHAGPGHRTAFSDGFPLLLVTQAALDHLNAQLPSPVDWQRFRPNIVVAGALPHAEDGWTRLRVGAVELAVVKPCSRCVIPSIDPATAVKDSQILTVLRSYRSGADGRTYFGQNVVVAGQVPGAVLRVGDAVEVLA